MTDAVEFDTKKSKMTKSSDVDSAMFQFGKTLEQRAILRSQICCDIYVCKQALPSFAWMVIKQSGREHR